MLKKQRILQIRLNNMKTLKSKGECMKKIFVSAVILGLLISASSVASNAITSNNDERGYITVNTQANKELSPDLVEISIAVETYDKSMQNAIAKNKEISDKVQAVLKSMINAPEDYIKTSDFNASPMYNYTNNKRVFDKYQVSNTIIVHTKNLDKVGNMIDKAIAAGATNINNLNFSISDYESQCDDLLTIAVNKAKNQASAVATAAGTTLNGVKYMNASCNSGATSRVYYNLMAKNAVADSEAAMGSSTPISVGRIKIQATLSSAFFVK